jgi:D-alanyl-lipoteichoic acid acyltransferase DltB (MBOAT superfamily)
MAFNSFIFWLIFPLIFVFYWAIPAKWNIWRKALLLVVSYLLYMNWKPSFALVLLGVTIVTYWGGQVLECGDDGEPSTGSGSEIKVRNIKHLVWLFALLGLLPLLVFKYYNFLNDSISAGLASIGLRFALPGLNWAIPVGISFFTFQAVGYMLDVYHERVKAEKNLLDYLLFVSFFPQVTSGPISKADELLPQIKATKKFNYDQAVSGLKYLLWGMFLKVVLADRTGIYVDTVFSAYDKFSGAGCALASVLYSIQIYADFAGYSLMAVGIAKTLGFDLINNFKRPYFATSVSEFWRRWHISLTRWLTQQVFIPMGGSRCSKLRNYWNILVTFFVSGIWHGANWTFIIWGVIHGIFQIIEKAFGWNKKESKGFVKLLRIVFTFVVVTMAWVIFRSSTIGDAFGLIGRYATTNGKLIADVQALLHIAIAFIPLLCFEIGKEFFPQHYEKIRSQLVIRWTVYLVIFAMIVLIGVHDGSSFIYVSF